MNVWVKLESNRYPFKVNFQGEDIYDLKKEIILELRPRLDSFSQTDLVLFPPVLLGKEAFQNDLIVSELLNSFGSTFQNPWIVQIPLSDWHFILRQALSSIQFPLFSLQKCYGTLTDFFNHINAFTWVLFIAHIVEFEAFPVYSVTGLLMSLQLLGFILLMDRPDFESIHFTSSAENLKRRRYWTLVLSTFAPIVETVMGWKNTLIFYALASVFSSLISLWYHGGPSIGSSGVLYAMEGYIIRLYGDQSSLASYAIDQALYYLATKNLNLDHAAHIGGFVFGYIWEN